MSAIPRNLAHWDSLFFPLCYEYIKYWIVTALDGFDDDNGDSVVDED